MQARPYQWHGSCPARMAARLECPRNTCEACGAPEQTRALHKPGVLLMSFTSPSGLDDPCIPQTRKCIQTTSAARPNEYRAATYIASTNSGAAVEQAQRTCGLDPVRSVKYLIPSEHHQRQPPSQRQNRVCVSKKYAPRRLRGPQAAAIIPNIPRKPE